MTRPRAGPTTPTVSTEQAARPSGRGFGSTPSSERLHIGIFGRRNAGKSSLINALTGQAAALVSDVPGTTTDPVFRAMELPPVGPVVFVDTAGIDDEGPLGRLRVERTRRVLNRIDVAILVVDAAAEPSPAEDDILAVFADRRVPVVAVLNKVDLIASPTAAASRLGFSQRIQSWAESRSLDLVHVSTFTSQGLGRLKKAIVAAAPPGWSGPSLTGALAGSGDVVVLVVPIDLEAPKGRLILPQVQTIRDLLDHGASAFVARESELAGVLAGLSQSPRIVITDSQAFDSVSKMVPPEVPLTSFSILFARHKGDLAALVRGALAIDGLRPGDRVLIAEACTHHPIGDDIGRLKIPRWLERKVGGFLSMEHCSGGDFPDDLASYKLVIHCGGCMIGRAEMLHRIGTAEEAGVPITNYGVAIAHLHGILSRAIAPFGLHTDRAEPENP